MLFSYNWLKEYIKDGLPEAEAVAKALTMSGTEVESVKRTGSVVNGVVTAQVLAVEKHPNADRLKYCDVLVGEVTHKIVCGASNMKAGDKVALALPGAVLPGGVTIKKSKIRGLESGGMMCSEVELGIKDTSDGIMILPPSTPTGLDIKEALGPSDAMMEVSVMPNRADLLSVRGLAREAAAVLPGALFADKDVKPLESGAPASARIAVTIETPETCARYMARVIDGVKIGPSPEEVVKRLEAHGIRSVNNVVDATNYVMLETGHPLHAFDLDKVKGAVTVRLSRDGESIETIDNKTRELGAGLTVIADSSGPVALAGVMGGKSTEITDSTSKVLLECAWFEPRAVRTASRKLGLSSDSSHRFERGVDQEGLPRAIDMVAAMIQKLAGGTVAAGAVDCRPRPSVRRTIEFGAASFERLLGVSMPEGELAAILKRLGMSVSSAAAGRLTVAVPSWRGDLAHETDLIEEAARVWGYENIKEATPTGPIAGVVAPPLASVRKKIAELLTGAGFAEVVNYSFVSRAMIEMAGAHKGRTVEVVNPLSEEQSLMRVSLLPSLLENLRYNIQRKNECVRIFETAPVYHPVDGGELPAERWLSAGLLYGPRWPRSWNLPKDKLDFYDVKGVVERALDGLKVASEKADDDTLAGFLHPGKCAAVAANGKRVAVFGELHPDLKTKLELKQPAFLFELDLAAIAEVSTAAARFKRLRKFPESARDVAFIVSSEVRFGEIIAAIKALDAKLIENVELFDVYSGSPVPEGSVSMALSLTYRSEERTLVQAEVDELHGRVSEVLVKRFGAAIRGV